MSGWSLTRGATPDGAGGVHFSVWAPALESLGVRLGAAKGRARDVPLVRGERGVFEASVADVAVGTDYVLRIGDRDLPDPVSRWQPAGVHGPSRVVDAAAFAWSDRSWSGRAMADLVLYELHVGTFTPEGTFEAIIPRLEELRRLGVTAIELMPVAEFPGARNWGYDGVHPYAPQSTYGGPEGLRRLVDAAHAADLAVILDVVYNHLGPEGNYLGEVGPYFTEFYKTPWGSALNFDGPESDEVRRYFVDNACYWAAEFHIDGLRLDAVHAICDFSARHLLDEIGAGLAALEPQLGWRPLVIAESDLNDPRLLRSRERGGYALDGQWSDDFHHALHVALTGERHGYYADFGGAGPVAKVLQDRFVFDGGYSAHRQRRHGAPAVDVETDRFVVFAQNHDQVGNRAAGDRLSTLVEPAALRLAAALVLLSPYVPLLFMGEEYGETNPFCYFVSHGDTALVDAVRAGRRREFAAFGWGDEVPDPASEETFRRSRLEWSRATTPGHAALRSLYADLLALRSREPALRPGKVSVWARAGSDASAPDVDRHAPKAGAAIPKASANAEAGQWLVAMFEPPTGAAMLTLFNLADRPQSIAVTPPRARAWTRLVTTDDPRYGGAGEVLPDRLEGEPLQVTLAPWSAVAFRAEEA